MRVALIGTAGALLGTFAVGVWALLKLTKWQIGLEEGSIMGVTEQLLNLLSYVLLAIVVVEVWPGVAAWASAAWGYVPL